MRRCRSLRRRLRDTLPLCLVLCLAAGASAFPTTTLAEPTSKTATPRLANLTASSPAPTLITIDPVAELPDLRGYPAGPKRKQAFLELLVPIVEAENARIAAQRDWLQRLRANGGPVDAHQRSHLTELCEVYGVECGGRIDAELLSRVDTLPLSLVVIQAIEESGWGTSRFARQGNNLFGMRCFSDGCGLAQRGSGLQYQAFDSVQDAVRSYLRNLNTNASYTTLRKQRSLLIEKGRKVTAKALIGALESYATRQDYQQALLGLLRTNDTLIDHHRSDDTV